MTEITTSEKNLGGETKDFPTRIGLDQDSLI